MPIGSGAYLGEDWQTQGDSIGRYGRQYAHFFAMQSPWGDHFPVSMPGYQAVANIGPRYAGTDALRSWVQWVHTENPRSLYDPQIGYRRQAEADDHGETVDREIDGPDIWLRVSVPPGIHRISLYLFNKDGHDGDNRERDYLVSLLPYRVRMSDAIALPALAHTRVRDFWGGVYKSFLVRGPHPYYLRVARNNSLNTICSAVFIDKLLPAPRQEDDMQTLFLGAVRYNPPSVAETKNASPILTVSRDLWRGLNAAPIPSRTSWRLLAFRSAASAGASPALLANWRWHLKVWQDSDRAEFIRAMITAHTSLLELQPQLKTAQK